jgi:hypothetical protein
MKRLLALALLATVFGGCVVTPVGYYDRDHPRYHGYYRDHPGYYYRDGYRSN